MGHYKLPIRSTSDKLSPAEQRKKWLSDDPKRFHKIQLEIDEWIKHFTISKKKPVVLGNFDGGGKEILIWWRDYLLETGQISAKDLHHV